ncbi:zinc-binding dehydrogenase [Parageobacillus thermoglucosidasius]|uniref:zinc-binding dehydrogenase n=1 Tax=Parageobacillus thermoglucosidasius TaxID=1426 RepID=UPI000B564036|nr:zinc-binding dehydrogenase [Parageobacillus thermoglucosidasius]OUM92067.1 MAG: alcohol dehydrogenase [Parageobacillus thermoglucosidasius]
MKAFIHQGNPGLENTFYTDMEVKEPNKGEVKVRLKTAGLNHRDIWNLYRRPEDAGPVVLGSDGAGVIEEVGPGVEHDVHVGDEVIINPSLRWPVKSDAPPSDFEIIGVPANGTFAEYIIVPAENVEPKPKHLSWVEAGVLPLAALTAYRALFTRGKLQPHQTVLIPGIGSGVATFALLMAKAVGARVIVTSRSEMKRKRAMELGADIAIDSESDWKEALSGEKVDLVIESVGPATWDKAMDALKVGGTIVSFGATSGDIVQINLRKLYFGQFNILGTTMGSHEEFREMLRFIEEHQIRPVIDIVYPLSAAKNAFKRMIEGMQFGKICLRIE